MNNKRLFLPLLSVWLALPLLSQEKEMLVRLEGHDTASIECYIGLENKVRMITAQKPQNLRLENPSGRFQIVQLDSSLFRLNWRFYPECAGCARRHHLFQ